MSPSPAVVVGLSGGVDSAMAALLLKRQGYQVRGLFMKNWDEDDGSIYCTAKQDLRDAQQIADQLDIELRTASFAAEYWDNVFAHFLEEYAAGRTPNPDIACNREIKFKHFADYALSLGADYIATGHYARLHGTGCAVQLERAADENKDQTYFLQSVPYRQFQRALFPLGDLHKAQVREQARAAGFANHAKKDSTGICFIGERRFKDFLNQYLPATSGPIVDRSGRTLGVHQGVHFFTLGQRRGIGLGGVAGRAERPWYVCAKDVAANRLTVTQNPDDLRSHWLCAADLNWLSATPPVLPLQCRVRVRHRQPLQHASISQRADGRYLVQFSAPQRAVNPGQFVAFYQDRVCLGGARIIHVGNAR